jgi:predicted  nucleic acid-binding Zn-ribbon protein
MIITSSEVKARLSETELLIKYAAEIEELKSQVADLQEELGNVLDIKNRQAWEIRFLKEDIARMSAKRYEKRHYLRTEDTED